jgi:L-histidine N-alpha-methyltransferase
MPTRRPGQALPARDPLLTFERIPRGLDGGTLAHDVRRGLTAPRKTLPSKYFYDERGSRLFDEICRLPEYYLTRVDTRLLRRHADELVALVRPTDVIELGAGSARKTRLILDALARAGSAGVRYVPMDVSESALLDTAEQLRRDYPQMPVHAIACDYEHHLDLLPRGRRRLVLFLGSTIGNFPPAQAAAFVRRIADRLSAGDAILLGMDLVKSAAVLHAAYNDAAGVTAEFNRNILRVVNRGLGADFRPDDYEHLAFFNRDTSQIEMHLRAERGHTVRIRALDLDVPFAAGETIHTEISRKFRRSDAEDLFAAAGCRLACWWTDERQYFAEAVGVMGT